MAKPIYMVKGKPYFTPLTCERTKPTFYRVEDPAYPRASNERKVWLTKSRGRATCPDDGAAVVTVTRDGRRTHLCVSCLANERIAS
jgi:hypothetical protein